ncbi:MAG: hypothetical protein PWQ93_777 [Clostridiales bacterium]|nr:hypothetical protein [Clostridiales bacterium]
MSVQASSVPVRKKRTGIIWWAIVFILLVIAGAAAGVAMANIKGILDAQTFYWNVSVDGVDLTGMTKDQAMTVIGQARQADLDKIKLQLQYQDKSWDFDYKDIAAAYDVEQQVEKAYAVGRQGSAIERLKEIYAVRQQGAAFQTTFTYDISLLKDDVEAIAKELEITPVDATVKFTPNVSAANRFKFTEERIGRKMDIDKAMEALSAAVENDRYEPIELVVNTIQPKVFVNDLKKATSLVAEFSTPLGNSTPDRVTNIKLASGAFNGEVVQPGEIFSINEATGERTRAKGYRDAKVFKEGGKVIEDDLAGGVCQVSSTLYNAVLMSGLDVVERYHHSRQTSYIDLGRDATISYGALDFKFKNNRKTPVFLERTVSNGRLTVRIYGEPLPNGQHIAINSEIYDVVPAPAPEMIVDKTLKPGERVEEVSATDGYRTRTYKIVYDKNGKRLSSNVITTDYYKPIQGVIRYNPEKPQPQPESGAGQ